MDGSNVVYTETILNDCNVQCEPEPEATFQDISNYNEPLNEDPKLNNAKESPDKNSAIWTASATLTLLKLYESKLEMLETPKKKTGMWIAISEELKSFDIEMTPDQVRWKINALTQKYKQCLISGQHDAFKYFKEMDSIIGQYNDDNDTYSVTNLIQKKKDIRKHKLSKTINHNLLSHKSSAETRAMIELRKIRLANRIESDRSQGKIKLEKQWLEYLKRQEEQKSLKDGMYDRHLKLREEELQLRKKELEMKQNLELKKIQLREREQEEVLQIEKEKCEMLRRIIESKKLKLTT